MADQVEEIKNKTDIVELVGEYITLKKAGRNFKANCPFHGEKTPSFMVNPELQIFKCFGCSAGGDVFEFLKRMEGMEFGEALQHLSVKTGVVLETYKPSAFEQQKEKLILINSKAVEYYHFLLTKHKLGEGALKYLLGRGISQEAIEGFKLGFAPDGWDFLTKYLVGKKGYRIEELERGGLVVQKTHLQPRLGQANTNNYYDRFRNRVMFPLNNSRGQTLGFAGRVIPSLAKASEGQTNQQAKYVNTPETEIYHKGELLYGLDVNRSEIKTKGWAVVVEGEVDCIASWQAGVKNVVAIKGSALTERQVELLRRLCDTVVLGLDADLAGDAAARRGIGIAQKQGLIIRMIDSESEEINPKKYKDPGDWATLDSQGWQAAVKKAIPIYDFYLESAVRRWGLDAIGKEKIGKELLPIWASIDDEIVRAHYIKKLASVLGVGEDDVRAQLVKQSNSANGKPGQVLSFGQLPNTKTNKTGKREVLEEYLVGLSLRNNWENKLKDDNLKRLIKTSFWAKVVDELKGTGKDAVLNLPAELRERVENLYLQEEEKEPEKEWHRAIQNLEELEIREKMESIKGKVDDKDIQKEMVKLTSRLSELTR